MYSFVALSLLTLAAASPVPSGGACPGNPPASGAVTSEGFTLRIQLADASKDKLGAHKINGAHVTGVHVGAGIDMVTPTIQDSDKGSVFYAKGNTVVRGFGNTSQGWRLETSEDHKEQAGAYLQFGPGSEGVTIIDDGKGGLMLGPKQYMVCDEHTPYGLAVEQTTGAVPSNCVAVTLIPECADLGAEGKGQKVTKSRCVKPSKA